MRVIIREEGIEYPTTGAPKIRTPKDASIQCQEIKESETEQFCVLVLDVKNRLKVAEIVTSGLADACLVHPREVFRTAVREGGAAIVSLHNHPSGDTTPSAEDIRITKQLIAAGRILDINVLDHVIIGANHKPCSLREDGLADFR